MRDDRNYCKSSKTQRAIITLRPAPKGRSTRTITRHPVSPALPLRNHQRTSLPMRDGMGGSISVKRAMTPRGSWNGQSRGAIVICFSMSLLCFLSLSLCISYPRSPSLVSDDKELESLRLIPGRHVNNVRFVRWIEPARIEYAQKLDLPEGMVLSMLVCPLVLFCCPVCPPLDSAGRPESGMRKR